MNNNQMPSNFGPFSCHCRGEINELQRRINHLENRVNRLENMVFNNNWGNWGGFNNPSLLNSDNRTYTTGNYIL